MDYHLFQVKDAEGNRKFLIIRDSGSGQADFKEARSLVKHIQAGYSIPLDARTLKLCSCCVPAINECHSAFFIDPTSSDEDPAFGFDIDEDE